MKKLLNMKLTVMPIVTGVLGTVTKGLVQGLEDLEIKRHMKTIQTTVLLGSAQILIPGDLRRLAITETPVENHQMV